MNDYRRLARETALRHGIDPDIFEAQIDQESRFNKNAVSSAGAQGLGQLMPGTAAELGVKNPWDPVQNLDGAARYLKRMLRQFGGYPEALAAYNSGPGTVARAGGVPNIPETINYVDSVTKGAARLRARGGGQSRPPAALRTPSPPMTDGGTLRTAPTGSSVRSEMMDPFVSTAKAGLEPQDEGHALMAALFAELAKRKGTSDFAPALREAIGPLNAMEPLSKLQAREAAAIFGTQQRMATGDENTTLQSFQPFQASTPDAMQSSGNPISAPTNGRGPIRVGKIAHPSQDVYPTTGPHLDVRVMKNGEYVNPEFARSLLQNLRVGGKPLYSQSGESWSPAYPITSSFGPRSAPTAGASTFHRGVDFGVPEGVELEWTGGGAYSRQPGYGQIDLPTGERIKLLHTIG